MMAPYFKKPEKDKKVLGMLQVGEVVDVLEMKTDKKGKAKVRHRGGWTPMRAPDGRAVMEPADGSGSGSGSGSP